jgi:uncharacterized protein (TIGR02145 family)
MYRNRFNLKKVVAIAICLAGFSVSNVFAQDNATDQGVVINGVKWATRNVDKPGVFSAKPEDVGMFYQWNRRIGWSTTDPMTSSDGGIDWDGNVPEGTEWKKSNDPSPTGWRVPTSEEIQSLLDTEKVINVWTTQNGVKGRKFTDKATNNSIFLPVTGQRSNNGGRLTNHVGGCYWSSTRDDNHDAYRLVFSDTYAKWDDFGRNYGYNIRPVAE